jgi:hypothetical protein
VGSAVWGIVASRADLSMAYLGIAAGFAAGGVLLRGLSLAALDAVDHTPAHHWPEPEVAGGPSLEDGPVMILVEYIVDAPNAEEFQASMRKIGLSRRRYGALHWSLFQDSADPARFVESWIEDTWAEHLRTHQRVSVADRDLEAPARKLVRPGSPIAIRHLIASQPHPGAPIEQASARTP